VTPSDPQDEPANIVKLQQEINNKYSSIHLIDILKECDLRINFSFRSLNPTYGRTQ
jgi:hypothetical protein